MSRTVLLACLLGLAQAATLKRCGASSKGSWCYGYEGNTNKWCWLTSDGKKNFVKEGSGGWSCRSYNGYSSNTYCQNAKKAAAVSHTRKKKSGSGVHKGASGSASGGCGGSAFKKYLCTHNKHTFKYQAVCPTVGQTFSGYGMSGGYTFNTYTITCDEKIVIKCTSSKCTSSYNPPASAGDTKPTGTYAKTARAGHCGYGSLNEKEVQEFLDLHNKMRCAAGAPPVVWDAALQCQAQQTQNRIRAFSHSQSYQLAIPAGENLATGTSVASAAWMWFTEYTQTNGRIRAFSHGTGHYTAMVWKGVTKIGCGIQRSGRGVIRCQYVGHPGPNMAGGYSSQLNNFYGRPSDFSRCGLTANEVKNKVKKFRGWGILHPTRVMLSRLGLYEVEDNILSSTPVSFWVSGAFAIAASVGLIVAMRRFRKKARVPTLDESDCELLPTEAQDTGLE